MVSENRHQDWDETSVRLIFNVLRSGRASFRVRRLKKELTSKSDSKMVTSPDPQAGEFEVEYRSSFEVNQGVWRESGGNVFEISLLVSLVGLHVS